MNINLAVDLDIHKFSGSGITEYESALKNCIVHKEGDKYTVTQRPPIEITEDSDTIAALPAAGRGVYYWERATFPTLFIVNNDTVYATTQDGGEIAGGSEISSGTERVTMIETVGTVALVILDPENNEGWIVNQAASSVTAIASNFPSDIVYGGAILDGYLFVMDEAGIIYNSDVDDPATFGALSFLEAERENDKGVYLGKHHDHIVAFGSRTIEFFYDAANTTGSPLNRRNDISYNIGCPTGLGVWENGDKIYFLGSNPEGQIAVHLMANFTPQQISNDTLNAYLSHVVLQRDLNVVLNGVSAMGHDILLMTIYEVDTGEIVPKMTISFDSRTGLWGFWTTVINGHTYFPMMAWTKRTGGHNATVAARYGEGIMANGDIFNLNEDLVPVDIVTGTDVYASGVYESGVYVSSGATSQNIEMQIRTGMTNAGISGYKFENALKLIMESTTTSQSIDVSVADESNDNFRNIGTIDPQYPRKEVHQGGRFVKRNHQFDYSGNEQIYIDGFDADISRGL